MKKYDLFNSYSKTQRNIIYLILSMLHVGGIIVMPILL